MKFALTVLMGTAVLAAACAETEDVETVEVICEATLTDSAGVTIGSLSDTVAVSIEQEPMDSVGGDPRPCYTTYNTATRSMTLNAKSTGDSASGSPVD